MSKKWHVNEDKAWFKMVHHGEFLGNIWMNSLSNISETHLMKQSDKLSKWIEND